MTARSMPRRSAISRTRSARAGSATGSPSMAPIGPRSTSRRGWCACVSSTPPISAPCRSSSKGGPADHARGRPAGAATPARHCRARSGARATRRPAACRKRGDPDARRHLFETSSRPPISPAQACGRDRAARHFALPPNPVTTAIDMTKARTVPFLIEGGEKGGMTGAVYAGEKLDLRALLEKGMAWASTAPPASAPSPGKALPWARR